MSLESNNAFKGKISSAHGNKGLVRVIFEKGLLGQAITTIPGKKKIIYEFVKK